MLTLFHDYTSPASAVAVARVQRLADEGLAMEFQGFESLGLDARVPVTVDVTAAVAELSDLAAAEGVVLRRPPFLPPTAAAHLVGALAEAEDLGRSWREACYRGFWRDGADLGDEAVLSELAATAGLDADRVRSRLAEPGAVAEVRRRVGAHRRQGVGGVPTILAQRTLVPGLLDERDLRALALL